MQARALGQISVRGLACGSIGTLGAGPTLRLARMCEFSAAPLIWTTARWLLGFTPGIHYAAFMLMSLSSGTGGHLINPYTPVYFNPFDYGLA